MNKFATYRNRRKRWARTGFAGFVLVWLNLALQPCALALDKADERKCPHCPPEQSVGHGNHGMSMHSSAVDELPCAISADDCSLIDDFKHDGRSAELKVKDAPVDVPLAIPPSIGQVSATRQDNGLGWHPSRSPPPDGQVPLHILYCVFLK